MTVKELIKNLSQYEDQEAIVLYKTEDNEYGYITHTMNIVYEDKDSNKKSEVHIA